MRRLLIVVVGLLGVGAAFGQVAPGEPIGAGCAREEIFEPLADRIIYGIPTGGPTDDSVECVEGGVTYEVHVAHLIAAVDGLGGGYGDGTLQLQGGDCSNVQPPNVVTICAEPIGVEGSDFWYSFGDVGTRTTRSFLYRYRTDNYSCAWDMGPGESGTLGRDNAEACAVKQQEVQDAHGLVFTFKGAYLNRGPGFYKNALNAEWQTILLAGVMLDCDEWGYCQVEGGEPGGGGTDWQEGQHKTRCDGQGGLNIFEKALFFAFEPCEPWVERFLTTSQKGQTKLPFGFASWFPCTGSGTSWCSGGGGSSDPTLRDLDGGYSGSLDDERPGFGFGSLVLSIPSVEFGGWEFPGAALDLRETRAVQWWHQHGRIWLYWGFVASFFVGVFTRLVQT